MQIYAFLIYQSQAGGSTPIGDMEIQALVTTELNPTRTANLTNEVITEVDPSRTANVTTEIEVVIDSGIYVDLIPSPDVLVSPTWSGTSALDNFTHPEVLISPTWSGTSIPDNFIHPVVIVEIV